MQYWEVGKQLKSGKFIVEEVLGDGGYGVTYKIKETNTERLFAVKTLNEQRQKQDNFQELQIKFFNEIIALASCRHPNIVRVYPQTFMEGGLLCMVMDYVKGMNLTEYVETKGRLSEADAISLITKVGNALIHVHQQDLLHRDIKPDNILLRDLDLEPVLIDFGLAREYIPDTLKSMTAKGTEHYAPIEQYQQYQKKSNSGAWTDVYALAATLYALLTERKPVPSDSRKDSPLDILTSPKYFNPDISDGVEKAILKGMAIEPGDRPQTVNEWLEMLKPSQSAVYRGSSAVTLQVFEFETARVNDRGEIIKRENHFAKYFTEDLGKGIALEMVYIPGGTFMMGTDGAEIARLKEKYHTGWATRENWVTRESPQHRVTVPEFYLGKFQVTQAQYRAIINNNPSKFEGNNLPVERVSWDDAVEFCRKLSKKTGKEYRLPSEAEWEYACRAGTTTPFHCGETITTNLANYNGKHTYANEPRGEYRSITNPVGLFLPNAFGLYDMHGNVWEWCEDNWHKNYQGAPRDGSAWLSKNTDFKVLRGGSWVSNLDFCRSAYRFYDTLIVPYFLGRIFRLDNTREDRIDNIGFRVVCIAPRTT